MNGFRLSDEQLHLREVAAKVAKEVYAPKAAQWDLERAPLPAEEVTRLAELGFLGLALPEEYGGAGGTLLDALIVIEELAKECRSAAFQVFEANVGPARVLEFFGTEEQRQKYLPKVVTGEVTMAIGISEPDAGSAATDMTTRARLEGDEYVINGTKRWISNGGHADHYLLYCRLSDAPGSKGIGAIIVSADTPGLSFGQRERLMGWRTIPSADLIFEDARVPAENLVVGPGGFRDLFGVFSIERLGNSTMSLALGQAALDRAVAYVQERKQFGRTLVEFQNVQMTVADMALQVEAARLLIYRAAGNAGRGLPDPLEVSLAKCFANEMGKRVSDLGMQMHGGNGYTEEFGLEALHRDAHGWAIAGGTPAIQRVRIASELFGRGFDQRPAAAR
ncbi:MULTISPECIES: acyl-CoA dehydrogenase family protein [Nonomuraea]|uniref:Acyl-CoA dehydrogenase family protein n=1 Tax=Nonomuraea ferruginea TaxID=46174 RepID=A0ABT4TDD4_9ACTN|nr:acyl-CoA dehydrogenase family protein [Nonomuraea ferruginea]MDA0647488.1 acyl-CoA dehydrogenase family protein [Nonomuraea ferruginea]